MIAAAWVFVAGGAGLAVGMAMAYWQRRKLSHAIDALLSEAALRRVLIDYSADVHCILGRDGTWTYVTPSVLHILGWMPQALIGRRWIDLVNKEDDDPFDSSSPNTHQVGPLSARMVSFRMRHKNGHWVWIDAQISRVRSTDDSVYWLIAARDVTSRKDAEVAQIQAHARLAQQASVDGLTSLFNRRHILAVLEKEAARAYRSGQPLCVLLIDIDHFKPLNDYYGHQHGDSCLVSVAGCLTAALLRPADVVGRYGGEEFMVLLPDTDARGMTIVAEKIRRSVEDMNQPHTASPFNRVTVSIGGVHIPASLATPSERYIGLADSALYRAKRLGRNRVVCSSESARASSSENVALASNRDDR